MPFDLNNRKGLSGISQRCVVIWTPETCTSVERVIRHSSEGLSLLFSVASQLRGLSLSSLGAAPTLL